MLSLIASRADIVAGIIACADAALPPLQTVDYIILFVVRQMLKSVYTWRVYNYLQLPLTSFCWRQSL